MVPAWFLDVYPPTQPGSASGTPVPFFGQGQVGSEQGGISGEILCFFLDLKGIGSKPEGTTPQIANSETLKKLTEPFDQF